jgi:5'-3' exoribonuclease 1
LSHIGSPLSDGYINQGGVINTKRLQVVLDEMTIWERDIFEKENSDSTLFKGKQSGPKNLPVVRPSHELTDTNA